MHVRVATRSLAVAGDLNATESEPAIAHAKRHLQDCFRARHPDSQGFTWSLANTLTQGFGAPDRRLDYAFCPPHARVREARVVLDRPDPVFPSDHFGLYVDIAFRGNSGHSSRPGSRLVTAAIPGLGRAGGSLNPARTLVASG